MPEIAEVARIVHYLKKYATGRVIKAVRAQEDTIVYGKVGTSAAEFEKAMKGKKIIDAKRQGKYFWLEMESAPHPLMHFGMSGWMKFSNDDTSYYRPAKQEEQEWPPKYWKFILELEGEPDCQVAFVDARRLARIRLLDAKAEDMRKTTPLKENGPDPILDKDILTTEWLSNKLKSKRVPVKALLLDQANISGIGNWVGDEIMYQAKLHPEQYSNTFTEAQVKQLHDAMMYVCDTAIETMAEYDSFPKHWLMMHRWGKGKKDGGKLPSGEKITFLKVGGRTSAIVPSVQKKTGAVAADVSDGAEDDDEEPKPKKATKRKSKAKKEEDDDDESEEKLPVSTKRGRGRKAAAQPAQDEDEESEEKVPVSKKRGSKKKVEEVKDEDEKEDKSDGEAPKAKKQKTTKTSAQKKATAAKAKQVDPEAAEAVNGRRRSGRTSRG